MGECGWEYFAPVFVGDQLTETRRVSNVTTCEGKRGGTMTMITIETDFTNQHDELVVRQTDVLIENGGSPRYWEGHHIINASTTTEFERRPRVGDHVSIVEEIVSISEPKTTRVGTGVVITTASTFSDQHGGVTGRNTNVLFRHDTADSEGAS